MDPITNWVVLMVGFAIISTYYRRRTIANRGPSTTQTSEPTPTSLGAFIDDNQRLITTLGAFAALTVFVGNLPAKLFGFLLSFLFLIGTVLLWVELASRFPKLKSDRLFWFQNTIEAAIPILVLYLILQFSGLIRQLLNYVMVTIAIWLTFTLMDRFKIADRIVGRFQSQRLHTIIVILLLAPGAILASFGTQYLLPLFDNAITLLESVVSTIPNAKP